MNFARFLPKKIKPPLSAVSLSPSGRLICYDRGVYFYIQHFEVLDKGTLEGTYDVVELTRHDMDFENMCREAWKARFSRCNGRED